MFKNFAKKITVLACLVGSVSLVNAQQLTIKGSDTVLPLSQKLAEVYLKKNSDKVISVVGGGSGVGIASLIDGLTDIAQASRSIKKKEIKKAQKKGIEPKEIVVGRDALTAIINPNNPVDKLTLAQMSDIFTGRVTNWKDVGGKDLEIVVYSRESSSGTYSFFKKAVMNKAEYSVNALLMPATGAIVQSVSQTEGAIGYIGFAYLTDSVKSVTVGTKDGKFVAPTAQTAANGTYPITRNLYYYTNGEPTGNAKHFIDFALSDEGQDLVKKVGYIKVK